MFQVIIQAIRLALPWLLPKIAMFFGIYVISNTVSEPIFNFLKQQALNQIGSAGAEYLNLFYLLGAYDALIIIFSAYALAISLKSLKSVGSK